MSNLATAYAMRRRAGKMPHQENPKLEESHMSDGGDICKYCGGGGVKMASGGMISEGMEMPHSHDSLDEDEESDLFNLSNVADEDLDNEMGDPSPMLKEDEDEAAMEKHKGKLLSRILGGIRKAHSGKA